MKFTLSWLKDHLETDASLERIVETLTMIGLEVEALDDRAAYRPFTIARVISAERHPNADKLKVLSVDAGDGKPVQVVCGAPNARAGLVGAFAAPGTYIPGIDLDLAVGNIRGVESHGMMCSERELDISDEHDGIIDLPEDAPVGTPFAAYAGLDDPVIEIGITPNRPDALGVSGIARDLEAAGLGKVKTRMKPAPEAKFPCPVDVKLHFPDGESLCPAFALRMVRGVKNGPSPRWMQQRLIAIGLRPISALVDITNYVTYDLGRPLHVFDADKVAGDLVVRRAEKGESVPALDGKTYKLTPEMCVIADDNGVESLAGIMGGEESGCTDETVNVLVESALWEPLNVARTGRDLGVQSDARYRFERGVDPAMMEPGCDHAAALIVELCGGEVSQMVVAGKTPQPDLVVDFPLAEVERLTGLAVDFDQSKTILSRLGFQVNGTSETVQVAVPSWRPDVAGKADLVEEIMRVHGVDRIEPKPLPRMGAVAGRMLTTAQTRRRNAKRALAARGMAEAVTWTFIPGDDAAIFGGGPRLANPISADMGVMRPSLLPGLIAAAQRNADRGVGDVALFEVDHTFQGEEPADQKEVAGGIRRGTARLTGAGRSWQGVAAPVDVFDAKADALAVLEACGLDTAKVQIAPGGPDWYHPGRSGTLQLGPKLVLGTFGEIHPLTLDALDVSGPICGFEVRLDALPEPRRKATRTKTPLEVSDLQSVRRDFAFIVDSEVDAASLIRAAAGAEKKLIAQVSLFDVFEDESLGAAKKSLAIEVTLQPIDHTLTDEEIDAVGAKIVQNVEKATGGMLRG